MFKSIGIILLCVFIGVSLFSFVKAVMLFKDNKALTKLINETLEPRITELENEKAKISDELVKAQNNLMVTQDELSAKTSRLKEVQTQLSEKTEELTSLTNKYNEIVNGNKVMQGKFDSMLAEFIELKKTLSSVDELKKRINELKSGSKKNKKKIKRGKVLKEDTDIYGNRGYFIYNGENTYKPRLRIEVTPLEE